MPGAIWAKICSGPGWFWSLQPVATLTPVSPPDSSFGRFRRKFVAFFVVVVVVVVVNRRCRCCRHCCRRRLCPMPQLSFDQWFSSWVAQKKPWLVISTCPFLTSCDAAETGWVNVSRLRWNSWSSVEFERNEQLLHFWGSFECYESSQLVDFISIATTRAAEITR